MTFKIVADRLIKDGGPVPFVPSPNVGGRMYPTGLVCHETCSPDADGAIAWIKNPKSKVSYHFVVDLDGAITQLVEFDRVAYHAGKSILDGRSNCNSFTIGGAFANPGKLTKRGNECLLIYRDKAREKIIARYPIEKCVHRSTPEHGNGYWLPYNPEQIEAMTGAMRALALTYTTIKKVTTHYFISPGRKDDPGPLFELDAFRTAVLTPQNKPPAAEMVLKLGSEGEGVKAVQQRLAGLGYQVGIIDKDFGPRTRAAVVAFEIENGLPLNGEIDPTDRALLESDHAKPFPNAVRENTTVTELAKQSTSTQSMVTGQNVASGIAVSSAAIGGVQQLISSDASSVPSIPLDKIAEHSNHAENIAGAFGRAVSALGANLWIVTLILGILAVVHYRKLIQRRLHEFVAGRFNPSGGAGG